MAEQFKIHGTMCDVGGRFAKSVARSSLGARRDEYKSNRNFVCHCKSCLCPIHEGEFISDGMCKECAAMAERGWLDA